MMGVDAGALIVFPLVSQNNASIGGAGTWVLGGSDSEVRQLHCKAQKAAKRSLRLDKTRKMGPGP